MTFLCPLSGKDQVIDSMRNSYDVKLRALVRKNSEDQKEVTIFNRELKWELGLIRIEADPQCARRMVEAMGVQQDSEGLGAPFVREFPSEEDGTEELRTSGKSKLRTLATDYFGIDRAGLQDAAQEACRGRSCPAEAAWRGSRGTSSSARGRLGN